MSSKHGYAAALSLLVVGGLGALAGCSSGDDDPPVTTTTGSTPASGSLSTPPSPTTSTTTAGSATATAVQIPKAARAHTEAGAEAFTRYFIEQAALAWTLPDTSLIPPLSDAGCLSCKDLQKTASELVTKHHRYASNPVTFQSVEAVGDVMGKTHVRVRMTQNKVDVVDSGGRVVLTDPFERLARTVAVEWKGQRWVLFDIA